jgi:hypothetical protein
MFEQIVQHLTEYETKRLWKHSNVVHGDPVFSNVRAPTATEHALITTSARTPARLRAHHGAERPPAALALDAAG